LVESPISAGVQHGAERRADDQRVRFRDRMRHGHKLDVERPEMDPAAERHDIDRNVRRARLAQPLGNEQRGGERCRIDRDAQPRPEIEQRAEMVFVRVREHQPQEIAPLRDQERDVRHDQVDAGQIVARKRHAEIDRDPLALRSLADAVKRKIHPDLADAAERREQKFLRHQASIRAGEKTSPTMIASSAPPGRRSIRRPM
jgi:hypothetical protein